MLRAALCSCVVYFTDRVVIHVEEEEVARLRQEKEQLGQELAGALEAGRRAAEELSQRDRELSGITRRSHCLPLIALFDTPRLTSSLICSAQGKHQEAPGGSGQGSGLLEGQLLQDLERSGPGSGFDQSRAPGELAPRAEIDSSGKGTMGVGLAPTIHEGCRGVCWCACP